MNMKPIIFVAINAKYAHTNLAVRSIAGFARQKNVEHLHIAEFTVNQRLDGILDSLYALGGGVYLFSCYIWNVEMIRDIAAELAKILPGALLLAGGPEASHHSKQFLHDVPSITGVLRGCGEASTTELLRRWQAGESFDDCLDLTVRTPSGFKENPDAPPLPMDALPFPYSDLDELPNRVLYYESMRGCPFSCAYCLSSATTGVAFRSPALVHADMQRFLDAGVLRVKFVDRTFNCNKKHAMSIWRYLQEHDNGVTNFHFELAGDLLDEDMLAFLTTLRPGLFQFEVGIQSTNAATLEEINRPTDLALVFKNAQTLLRCGNIHLHLDLIAGLPLEDLDSFVRSFDTVYALHPHQLQLGFLKVLGGSAIAGNAHAYGIVHRGKAPYEVLATKWLDYAELRILKSAEQALELYYNSGRFAYSIRWLEQFFPSAFQLYRGLGQLYQELGYDVSPPGKLDCYQLLATFMERQQIAVTDEAQWLCKYDLMRHEKIKTLPAWITVDGCTANRERFRKFYTNPALVASILPHYSDVPSRRLEHLTFLEAFPFHPETGEPGQHILLMDYRRRDINGHASTIDLTQTFHAF